MLRATGTQPEHASLAAAVLGGRIIELCDELAQFSEEPGRLTCTYLTPAHRAVASQLASWMQAAGLETRIDTVGNVIGRFPCADPNAKTLIVGSHYDTVRDAGKYDGRLGIVTALVVAEELSRRQFKLPFHLELIAFAEEEGVRFGTAYLGSRVIAGRFEPELLHAPRRVGRDGGGGDRVGRRPIPPTFRRSRAGPTICWATSRFISSKGRCCWRPVCRSGSSPRSPAAHATRFRSSALPGTPEPCRWPRGTTRRPRPPSYVVPGDTVPEDAGAARHRRAVQRPRRRDQRRSGPLRPVARHPLRG